MIHGGGCPGPGTRCAGVRRHPRPAAASNPRSQRAELAVVTSQPDSTLAPWQLGVCESRPALLAGNINFRWVDGNVCPLCLWRLLSAGGELLSGPLAPASAMRLRPRSACVLWRSLAAQPTPSGSRARCPGLAHTGPRPAPSPRAGRGPPFSSNEVVIPGTLGSLPVFLGKCLSRQEPALARVAHLVAMSGVPSPEGSGFGPWSRRVREAAS